MQNIKNNKIMIQKKMSPLMLHINASDPKKVANLEHHAYRKQLSAQLGRSPQAAYAQETIQEVRLTKACTYQSLPPELQNEQTVNKFLAAAIKDGLLFPDEINEFKKKLEGFNGHDPVESELAHVIKSIVGFVARLTIDEIITKASNTWSLMKEYWARECADFLNQQQSEKTSGTEAKAQGLRVALLGAKIITLDGSKVWKDLISKDPKNAEACLLAMIDNYTPEELWNMKDMGALNSYLNENYNQKYQAVKAAYIDAIRAGAGLSPTKKK